MWVVCYSYITSISYCIIFFSLLLIETTFAEWTIIWCNRLTIFEGAWRFSYVITLQRGKFADSVLYIAHPLSFLFLFYSFFVRNFQFHFERIVHNFTLPQFIDILMWQFHSSHTILLTSGYSKNLAPSFKR